MKALAKIIGAILICLSIGCFFYKGVFEDQIVKQNIGASGVEYTAKIPLHQGFVLATQGQLTQYWLIQVGIYGGFLVGAGLLFGSADRNSKN